MNRKQLLNVAKLLLAVGLIGFVVHTVGWDTIQRNILQMDGGRWAVGLALVFVAHCLSMYRWHLLMVSVGLNSTPWLALRLGFLGVFFNNIVVGLTGGDLVKAFYVTRENPDQRTAAVVSVIVDRVIGIVALALIAAVIIPFDLSTFGEAAIGIYGFLLAAGLGGAMALSRRAKERLRALRARFGKGSQDARVTLLGKVDQAISIYRNRLGRLGLALVMSFAVHLLIIAAIQSFGVALAEGGLEAIQADPTAAVSTSGEEVEVATRVAQLETLRDLGLDAYCSIIPIIMIISALPIAPAGWGVGEVAFIHFFDSVRVSEDLSTTLSLTYRISAMLISLLGGIALLTDRKRVAEARTAQQS